MSDCEFVEQIDCPWVTYEVFNEFLPVSRQTFNNMCNNKRLRSKKIGRTWYVHRSEIED